LLFLRNNRKKIIFFPANNSNNINFFLKVFLKKNIPPPSPMAPTRQQHSGGRAGGRGRARHGGGGGNETTLQRLVREAGVQMVAVVEAAETVGETVAEMAVLARTARDLLAAAGRLDRHTQLLHANARRDARLQARRDAPVQPIRRRQRGFLFIIFLLLFKYLLFTF
jgi:hypothetical protein